MPLKALRPGRSERDLKRRSTLDPGGFFKRVDKDDSRPGRPHARAFGDRTAVSHDGSRPTTADLARRSLSGHRPPSPPVQQPTANTRRFSLMRLRHASDSQLAAKAREQAVRDEAPPVPALPALPATTATMSPAPAAAPAIITTAPNVVDQEAEHARKRSRLQQFTLRRRSFDPSIVDRPGAHRPLDFRKSQASLTEETEHQATREPRVSTDDAAASVLPVPRASESSRSEGSSGGHVSFENMPRLPRMGSTRFAFGRRKQRGSLFPLPMKVETPQTPHVVPATPRLSTGGRSSGSPPPSSTGSPPPTARHVSEGSYGADPSSLPSATQVALTAASLNLATPRPASLFRTDSTKSTRSVRSSPNGTAPGRLALRGRSSTMGSLAARDDDDDASPAMPDGLDGRVSISTVGRSSFSNLFGLSQGLSSRFRQGHEPHSVRHGSPAHGLMGSSTLSSKQNSFHISRETLVLPEREEGETPGHYLERLEANNFNKSVVASHLSKTEDAFLLSVLRSYMRKFAFFGDPLDMAIRKLLMQVELPKETQQIDRVLQGFSDRYHECNPGIYISPDKAYFISFSIVILHTDFFNKNNKRKMQRLDYIKNSSCEGVSDDVLGCIYDNIIYTPFIHIEEDVDLRTISSKKSRKTILKGPMNDSSRKAVKEPLDPYTLIFEGKLDALRPTIKDVMNLDDPYSYLGTAASLDTKNIYKSFSRYGVIQIVSSRSRPEAYMSEAAQENPLGTSVGIVEMPVTKVGILWRKDTKRKKARSPWQEWGAVLTRSGLSLFRNSTWAKSLMHQHDQHQKRGDMGPVIFQPPLQDFKQDNVIPMDGAVCLVDNTYKKHKNAFVMFSKAGEETFLADSENDLNDWLGVLNYTAAFETLGVRSRGMVGGLYEGQMNRGLRRLHSSHSGKSIPTATEVTIQSEGVDNQFAQQVMVARKELMQQRISESEEKLTQAIKELEARLRDARHLQILAPIQPKTRELVIIAAARLAARLKWARIEIWRMKCHRDILAQELEDERQSATERQARNSCVAETSPTQQQLPPLSPQQSNKTSKGPLARLNSKASSMTNTQKPSPQPQPQPQPQSPLSPEPTLIRLGTKSSKETDLGEDAFKTPPETSQSSPTCHPAQFHALPMSFEPATSERRSSIASSSAQSPRMLPSDHRPSVSTTNEGTLDSDDDSDTGSRYTTPPPTSHSERMELRMSDIPPNDGLHLDPDAVSSEVDSPLPALTGSPTSRSKQRRSLHRTLRDSHGGSTHRRSHKGRDSASTILSDDTQGSEGLMRSKGSFTLHGKKASVIQFGPDWHNTTAEERLKTKKQLQEAAEVAYADERDGMSIINGGMVLTPSTEGYEENAPRRPSTGVSKQRHISAQTVTPVNLHEKVDSQRSDEDGAPELGDIAEEPQSNRTLLK